ncbi:MAG: ferrochelatase [Alteromonadaceae bacterium]|nr:ferrochelatase [Alteromonadaceae bacterium]
MRFRGVDNFRHDQPQRVGLLITNLGTPDAPTPSALRRYLGQFLSDPRVVEAPRLLWWFVLHGVILRIRPRRSAEAYASVWGERGSPLMYHTEDQCKALAARLRDQYGEDLIVDFAMRYGAPSIAARLDRLQQQGVTRLVVVPLYPQYSGSTSASTFDALSADFRRRRWLPELRFVMQYHDFPPYIDAMATRIERHWAEHGRADKLIFSFHGIPKRYLLAGDPYFCQCHKSARLLAERLGLKGGSWMVAFQSLFGREEWLKPYLAETLKTLPGEGTKAVQIFCPGFSADCLETIEEVGVENRDYFLEAGGERYEYISALNAEPAHIDALVALVGKQLQGWDLAGNDRAALATTRERAMSLGAGN